MDNLLNVRLERKIAYIREQELEHHEDNCAAEAEAELAAGLERLAPKKELDTAEESVGKKPYNKYAPKEVYTELSGGKGFAGTSLLLFPNVRETKVELGNKSRWFALFGINRRVGTLITMYLGPNHRSNRYLTFQYTRLFKSIGGTIERKTVYDSTLDTKYVKKSVS
jgi:hypothetical protein